MASNSKSKHQELDPFDQAFWKYALPEDRKVAQQYKRLQEIPFDPERRRNTVLVKYNTTYILISRGAFEALTPLSLDSTKNNKSNNTLQQWIEAQAATGCRILAVAYKQLPAVPQKDIANQEHAMTLLGLIAFQDSIKPTARNAILKAGKLNVSIKMLTGDSKEVACAVAQQVELTSTPDCALTGAEFDLLTSTQKQVALKQYAIFARVSPKQKHEIVTLLKAYHTVGFLGEGINDAPALKAAHVSLVVQNSADIAQDVADIVLLQKSLHAIIEGIYIGRTVFANTIKYIKITLSANLGNFYSVALVSLLVDFLPLLPIQILLVNMLSDVPMISIATDSVDQDELTHASVYNTKELAFSALIFGSISSLFDFMFFALFYRSGPSSMQTNWFIFSILTELAVIYSLRAKKPFYKASRPSSIMLILSYIVAFITLGIPFTHFGQTVFTFNQPTRAHIGTIILLIGGYFTINEIIKALYYRANTNNQTTV